MERRDCESLYAKLNAHAAGEDEDEVMLDSSDDSDERIMFIF
jgi:hypothetical protein